MLDPALWQPHKRDAYLASKANRDAIKANCTRRPASINTEHEAMKAKLERDIEDTRERIAAYNASALLADQIAEQYGSHGWSAERVAAKLRARITSSREQLITRIHRAGPMLTAAESRTLIAKAQAIGPEGQYKAADLNTNPDAFLQHAAEPLASVAS